MEQYQVMLPLKTPNDPQQSTRVSAESGACWSSGNGQPARWWNEGETLTRGRYWYECRRGRLDPKGCVTETNRKLNIGSTVEAGGYVAICELARYLISLEQLILAVARYCAVLNPYAYLQAS
ncbi:hypothetical protein COOONC_09867 [Cooperia oncophora]